MQILIVSLTIILILTGCSVDFDQYEKCIKACENHDGLIKVENGLGDISAYCVDGAVVYWVK